MAQSFGTGLLTGQTGPASAFAAIPMTNLLFLSLSFPGSVGHVEFIDNTGRKRSVHFDLVLTTTLVDTITALGHAIAIS